MTSEALPALSAQSGPQATTQADLQPSSLPVVDFGPDAPAVSCSWNECTDGHRWPPAMQVTGCPGCKAPILAVKMVQCPVCNEPVTKLVFRSDHMPHGGQVTPMCRGAASLNEVLMVAIDRGHAASEAASHTEREMISKA